MWLALPSPAGRPTTSLGPTSRMMSSAMASGSEKILGIGPRLSSAPAPPAGASKERGSSPAGCPGASNFNHRPLIGQGNTRAGSQTGAHCNDRPFSVADGLPSIQRPLNSVRMKHTGSGIRRSHRGCGVWIVAGKYGSACFRVGRKTGVFACRTPPSVSRYSAGLCGHAQAEKRSALVKAYQSNPQINAGRAQQRATDENVPQALAGYRPQIVASLSAGLQPIRNLLLDNTIQTATLKPWTIGVTVTQNLFSGFKTANASGSRNSRCCPGARRSAIPARACCSMQSRPI